MTFASASQFHVYLPWGQYPFSIVSYNSVLNVKALVGTFNQEKALVGAFPVIVQLQRLIVYTALVLSVKCSVTEFYWQRYEILYRRRHNIATLWMTLSTWEEEIRTLFCKERSIHSANTPFLFYFVPILLTILRTQFN